MSGFLQRWGEAALTTASFFWMAFWAFVLGYVISSSIQVFVTRERMQRSMGSAGSKSIALATFFGFISSSCSFAAIATAKSLFKKGAGFVPAMAFLLASTNLVIELGIVIAIFLSWQFVVGEYVGGILLILFTWLFARLTLPRWLEKDAREHVEGEEENNEEVPDWRKLIKSVEGWRRVAHRYFMEWAMVWRDVVFGFTVAGIISAFVPNTFFTTLFVGAGQESEPAFWQVVLQALIGPVAAFFTFIGSMGNIPLASILYNNNVSFAGVMAFIFSDLVVFPVLRINSKYFGTKMAIYILAIFFASLVLTSVVLHYGFSLLGMLPDATASKQVQPLDRFAIDYTFFLNLAFLGLTGVFAYLRWQKTKDAADGHSHSHSGDQSLGDRVLTYLAYASIVWLTGGLLVRFL